MALGAGAQQAATAAEPVGVQQLGSALEATGAGARQAFADTGWLASLNTGMLPSV